MLCTAIGQPPPMVTEPIAKARVGLRGISTNSDLSLILRNRSQAGNVTE
jgi:hypothetical protein